MKVSMDNMAGLSNTYEAARARGLLYGLLQQLYLRGLYAETVSSVQAIPDLAATLPAAAKVAQPDQRVLDQLAASHQELFYFHIFPYESIFLGTTGLLGSDSSDTVLSEYQRVGYEPSTQASAIDHLSEQLGVLAHLSLAEADAWEDQQMATAKRMINAQHVFLQNHLLRWFAPCLIAIERQNDPFFANVAAVTRELLSDHYHTLTLTGNGTEAADAQAVWSLPEKPALLDDPKTSLKDIANFLTIPAYSGLFISRHLINRLGRVHQLPRGFGSREQMLTNLLRTAAQYELLPALLGALQEELTIWQQHYQTIGDDDPQLQGFIAPWQFAIGETKTILDKMDLSLAVLVDAQEPRDAKEL